MNSGFRCGIVFCLLLVGGATAIAQEATHTTQTVSFSVSRNEAPLLQTTLLSKETMTESHTTKVTVSLDHQSDDASDGDVSLRMRGPHLDMAAVPSTDLQMVFKARSLLVTITD